MTLTNVRAEKVIEAVSAVLSPVRARLEQVENAQHEHEARTQRQVDRLEQVATRTLTSVTTHVERLVKLETIPERMHSLESSINSIGTRVAVMETRWVKQDAEAGQRQETRNGLKWAVENWQAFAAFAFILALGYAAFQLGTNGNNQRDIYGQIEELIRSGQGTGDIDPPPRLRSSDADPTSFKAPEIGGRS